jgi:hypothetical protein
MSTLALEPSPADSFGSPRTGQKRKYSDVFVESGDAHGQDAQTVAEEVALSTNEFHGMPTEQQHGDMLQVSGMMQAQQYGSDHLVAHDHMLGLEDTDLAQSVLQQNSLGQVPGGLSQAEQDLEDAALQQETQSLVEALERNRLEQEMMTNSMQYTMPSEMSAPTEDLAPQTQFSEMQNIVNSYQEVPGVGTTGGGASQSNDYSLYSQDNGMPPATQQPQQQRRVDGVLVDLNPVVHVVQTSMDSMDMPQALPPTQTHLPMVVSSTPAQATDAPQNILSTQASLDDVQASLSAAQSSLSAMPIGGGSNQRSIEQEALEHAQNMLADNAGGTQGAGQFVAGDVGGFRQLTGVDDGKVVTHTGCMLCCAALLLRSYWLYSYCTHTGCTLTARILAVHILAVLLLHTFSSVLLLHTFSSVLLLHTYSACMHTLLYSYCTHTHSALLILH